MGLGEGIGQKRPCHHLGPFFSNFLPEKILGYLKEFLRKKLKSAKKVTKLPALTVLNNSWNFANGLYFKVGSLSARE
jgi:hypothetical protein